MEPEGSLPHSQQYATCLYPGPAQSSPYTHIPQIHPNIIHPSMPRSPQWSYLISFLLTYLLIHTLTYLITYSLTPRCRVLLEQLTGLQLVKKLPAFHGTRRFITALTTVRHLSLSWASPIQSIYPHPTDPS